MYHPPSVSIFDVELEVNSKRTDAGERKPGGSGPAHTRERQRDDLEATLVHCPLRERRAAWVGVARLILLLVCGELFGCVLCCVLSW